MKRMTKGALLLLVLALLLSACTSSDAVAKVDGEDITQEEFDREFAMHKKLYEWQYGEEFLQSESRPGRTMEDELKKQVTDLLIMYRLIEKDLADHDITLTDEEVAAQVEETKATMNTEGEENGYETFKEQTKFTDEEFTAYNRQNLMYQKHRDMYGEEHPVDDAQVEQAYELNKEAYDAVTASHILVETEEEAVAAKERIDGGEAFADVAKDVSTDGSAQAGGELGSFNRMSMVPEFSDAAFSMEVDEISDPVQSQYGWHLIHVTDKTEGADAFRDDIEMQLQNQGYTEYLQSLEEQHEVERLADFAQEVTENPNATEAPAEDHDHDHDHEDEATEAEADTEATE